MICHTFLFTLSLFVLQKMLCAVETLLLLVNLVQIWQGVTIIDVAEEQIMKKKLYIKFIPANARYKQSLLECDDT